MGKLEFPDGFMWGAATSSHQVEGGNHNDWTAWEKRGGHIKDGSVSGAAADHWHRYAADYQYLSDMHLGAYRFSIEWSRVEPREGEYDEAALRRYGQMLRALHSRGITPMVTLHHFTEPEWVGNDGWADPRTVARFVRYATRVVEEFGEDVGYWVTINEPSVETGLSFMVGTFPPGQRNIFHFARSRRNMLSAHRQLYSLIHTIYRRRGWKGPQVGFAHHITWVEPVNPRNPLDRLFTRVYGNINNRYFIDRTGDTSDFIGVNYYFYRRLKFRLGGELVVGTEVPTAHARQSDLGWLVVPPGLTKVCLEVAKLGKPVIVTENGVADAGDELRQWSLVQHAAAIHRAIAAGADIRGYFHWSLIDTFEWENGYDGRYGLVAVDFATQERTPRPSAKVYAQIARANAVSDELQERYA